MPITLPPGFVAVTGNQPLTEISTMKGTGMITFKSVGHLLATFWSGSVKLIEKIEGTETTVETVTAAIPGGSSALGIERVAYAVLGELGAVLSAGGEAAKAKLTDAGLDTAVVTQVESLLKDASQIATLAKTVIGK